MRKLGTAITVVCILTAALLGWYIPLFDFDAYDRLNDGVQKDLEIRQINLSYRDDLTMNQKINIANYENDLIGAIELDKGIFTQEEELAVIMGDFLADFTGYRFDVTQNWYATPMLVNLSNNRGNIVVWAVDILLNEYWDFQCFVDDKTGAILRCAFYGDPEQWESLVHGFDDVYSDGAYDFLCNRFRTAIYNHYAARLDAKIVTFHMIGDPNDDSVMFLFVFKDDRNYTFEFTSTFSIPSGRIEPY